MAAPAGVPKWLNDSKDHVSTTKEWKSFTTELHQAIQQQLKESRVSKFADLTEAERTLFLERAAKAVQNGQTYRDFYAMVSHSLDQHINNEVARQLMEEFPLETKSDLILDQAQEGAMALLRRWPDMKSKLRACLNQPLPGPIRQLAWRLYLENTKVRKVYTDLLTSDPRAAISQLDLQISQKCDYLLKAEATFSEIKGSVGAFYGMKAVLSYHHRRKKTGVPLSDIEFMLVVPFIHVTSNKMSRREPAPGKVVALVVEEYTTFIDSRPGYMVDSGSEEHEKEMESFAQKVSKYVKDRCPEVTAAVSKAYVPDQEQIVSTEAGSQAALTDGMTRLIRPVIRSLFSGYLHIETLLYVWDQYIIGTDVVGFNDLLLPILISIHLVLLKEKLKDCTSPAEMETTLKLESPKLKVHQFQQQIKLYYYDELANILHQDDKANLPVLDPTQAKYAPWTHWYSDRVPPRVGPADRRQARQERDSERDEQISQQRAAEARKRQLEENQRKEDYLKFIEQQEAVKFNYDRQRAQLEERLQAERKQRIETERNAQRELEKLREEIEELKRAKMRSSNPSLTSVDAVSRYLIPPPPTASSAARPEALATPARTPTPNRPPKEQTADIILDFFRKVAHGFDKIGHGQGREREDLDRKSEENIQLHKEDIKHAQVEVFGRQLKPDEFESLPDNEKQDASKKMMDVVKRRMHERRQNELDNLKK